MIDSDVSLQVGLDPDSVLAEVAFVRLLTYFINEMKIKFTKAFTGVSPDVSGEVRGRLEGGRAALKLTREWSISCVSPQVDCELAAVFALVRTDLTVVGPLVSVDPHLRSLDH